MLDLLNPFIRFARVIRLDRYVGGERVAFDNKLFVCLEGNFTVFSEGEYRITEKNAMFVPPYIRYRMISDNAKIIAFDFDLTAEHREYVTSHSVTPIENWDGSRLYDDITLPFFDKAAAYRCENISEFMRVTEIFCTGTPFCRELAAAALKSAMIGMISEPQIKHHEAVGKFISLVKERYMNDITAGELAREIGYHEGYLNRLVKKELGIRASEYIINYRISRAKEMFDSGVNVSDTALACGYTDLPYFSQCFKHHVGMTPSEYRRGYRVI